jgi:hypothetical protein
MDDAPLLDLIEARKAAWAGAEAGAAMAADHAERVEPGWNDAALDLLLKFAVICGGSFLVEDVRAFAEEAGLGDPPDPRAWGSVVLCAKRAGLIESLGYASRSRGPSHSCPRNVWRLL